MVLQLHWEQTLILNLPGRSEYWIQRALDRGSNYTIEDIARGIESGEMHLLHREDAAVVFAVQEDEVRFCLILTFSCEDMSRYMHYMDDIHQWAREQGCVEMRVHGRKAWSKVLDYEIIGKDDDSYIMRKQL